MNTPDFLLLSQKEELFSKIKQAGLDPSEFMWNQTIGDHSNKRANLIHKSSKYYFKIIVNKTKEHFECIYSPGEEFLEEGPKYCNWGWVLIYFSAWLNYLKLQTSTPDVWTMLDKSNELTEAVDLLNDSEGFTNEEVRRISQGISEIKQFLIDTNELNAQQLKFIGKRLDHLEKVSPTLNKKDWLLLAIGTLTSIIVTVCLTPENSRELFRIASSVFSWIQQGYLTLPDF